jgi:hypothetical protein
MTTLRSGVLDGPRSSVPTVKEPSKKNTSTSYYYITNASKEYYHHKTTTVVLVEFNTELPKGIRLHI